MTQEYYDAYAFTSVLIDMLFDSGLWLIAGPIFTIMMIMQFVNWIYSTAHGKDVANIDDADTK